LMSDVLGRGKSARMYQKLLKERQLFANINAYNTSSIDPGLLVVQGNLNAGVSLEEADAAIEEVLQELVEVTLLQQELSKVKNQAESTLAFSEVELLNRAMNLAYAASVGNPDLVNLEAEKIQAVTVEEIQAMAKHVLRKENCSTLYYRAVN
jgi:zinc protease